MRGARFAVAALGVMMASTGLLAPAAAATVAPTCAAARFGAAQPDKQYDSLFSTYGNENKGARHWTGADSTYSVRLPDGRQVWLFSDTFLSPVNSGGTRSVSAPFIHNSLVVQRGGALSTRYDNSNPSAPDAFLHPQGADPQTDWYWVGGAAVTGDKLTVLYTQWHLPPGSTDPLGDLVWKKNVFAQYSLTDLHLLGVHDLPSAVPQVERGSWILTEGGYTYVYAVQDLGAQKNLEVSRVRGSDLDGPWEFRTANGWSTDEQQSAPLMSGIGNEYSVTKYGSTYLLVSHDTSTPLNNTITGYTACSPFGPFTNKTVLYQTPEGAPGSTYCGPISKHCSKNVFSYNSHVHPELSSFNGKSGKLLISYNVNSLDLISGAANDNYQDTSIYRPRFVEIPYSVEVPFDFTGAGR